MSNRRFPLLASVRNYGFQRGKEPGGDSAFLEHRSSSAAFYFKPTMIRQTLGRSELKISSFTLGCCFFGSTFDESQSVRIVDRALAAGINALDTAESYGPPAGASEEFLGRYLKGRRHDLVISTKVGPTRR